MIYNCYMTARARPSHDPHKHGPWLLQPLHKYCIKNRGFQHPNHIRKDFLLLPLFYRLEN